MHVPLIYSPAPATPVDAVRALGRRLVTAATLVAVVGVCTLTLHAATETGQRLSGRTGADLSVIVQPSQDQTAAEALIAAHGCWTGEAPTGAGIPGHAVVMRTHRDHGPAYVASAVGFGMWLGADGAAGTGDETPGALFAFCP